MVQSMIEGAFLGEQQQQLGKLSIHRSGCKFQELVERAERVSASSCCFPRSPCCYCLPAAKEGQEPPCELSDGHTWPDVSAS